MNDTNKMQGVILRRKMKICGDSAKIQQYTGNNHVYGDITRLDGSPFE